MSYNVRHCSACVATVTLRRRLGRRTACLGHDVKQLYNEYRYRWRVGLQCAFYSCRTALYQKSIMPQTGLWGLYNILNVITV